MTDRVYGQDEKAKLERHKVADEFEDLETLVVTVGKDK